MLQCGVDVWFVRCWRGQQDQFTKTEQEALELMLQTQFPVSKIICETDTLYSKGQYSGLEASIWCCENQQNQAGCRYLQTLESHRTSASATWYRPSRVKTLHPIPGKTSAWIPSRGMEGGKNAIHS